MQLALRGFKYSAFASEETPCFRATLLIAGVKRGEVWNDGHGGETCFSDHGAWQMLEDYARTLPPTRYRDVDLPQTAAGLIDDLVARLLSERDMKRAFRTRILFTKAGDARIWQSKALPAARVLALLAQSDTAQMLGAEHILNLLPAEQALDLYLAAPEA